MVTRLYVDNFRCLSNFELRLDETNVLLGPNGSGKTSVLDILRRIQALVARGARIEEAFPARDLSLLQDREDQRFELDLETDGGSYRYILGIQHDRDRRRMRIRVETLEHDGNPIFSFRHGTAQLYHDDYAQGPEYPFDWSRSGVGSLNDRSDNRKLTRFRRAVANFVVASPCPPLFEPETRSEDEFIQPFMQNFVGWYRQAAHENMGAISGLFKALGDVLPGFDSISLMASGENTRALKVAFRRAADDGRLDVYGFGQLSDGQRALLALYCLVFLSSNRCASLFLDEPDNYVALREIQPWLVAVGEHCGETLEQAVVVSHHPVTIDYMAGAKGRWFYRDGNGPVRVSDQPDRSVDGVALSDAIVRGWDRK
ncbi:MAG: AAA family ATPase [Acidobacteria bacterium]|nr:AAA family ATPase [Acidobacteriota bacterium]